MAKQPFASKIEELENIIIEKDKQLVQAYQRINELETAADEKFMKSSYYKQLTMDLEIAKESNKTMQYKLELLQDKIQMLQDQIEKKEHFTEVPKHNARNAGRKKADEKWVASFNQFIELYEYPKKINEIMEEMNISRTTYYRYKKLYEDTNVSIEK